MEVQPWLDFYSQYFQSGEEAEDFVQECENLHPSMPNHVAKIMMHQTQRLVSIMDDLPQVRPNEEPLQVLFLVMLSENIAKLHDSFRGQGKSRKYVRKFFGDFLLDSDKGALSSGFTDNSANADPPTRLGFREAVDLLYDIRCDVVHEGNYSHFAFHDGRMPMVNTEPDVIANIQLVEVRDIVVRGCINAVKDKLPKHQP